MNTTRLLLLGVGVFGAAFALWFVNDRDAARRATFGAEREAQVVAETRERTVADAWTLRESEVRKSAAAARDNSESQRIDAASVRSALRDVRLDEAGNVIVDHRALTALRDGFASIDRLDPAQLAELQDIIRNGLPPPAGEQTATIVGNYYEYQLAAQTMLGGSAGESIGGSEAQLERLIALRQSYFGAETAEKLFGDEQAYARFTLESMRIASDDSLPPEEKQKRQEALAQTLPASLKGESAAPKSENAPQAPGGAAAPVERRSDFQLRYAEFERQKQAILAAGLVEEEKSAQLERLLHEHFAADEIDLALRYDAERAAVER